MIKGFLGRGLSAKMNISRRGHNTCDGSVARHIQALIHDDNVSNTASRVFISEARLSSVATKCEWAKRSVL